MIDFSKLPADAARKLKDSVRDIDGDTSLVADHIAIVMAPGAAEQAEPLKRRLRAAVEKALNKKLAGMNSPDSVEQRLRSLAPWLGRRVYERGGDTWSIGFTVDEDLKKPWEIVAGFSPDGPSDAPGVATIPYTVIANPTIPAKTTTEARSLPAGWLRLEWTDRSGKHETEQDAALIRVGRDIGCEVVLDADDVLSRFHLEFRLLAGGEAQVRNTGRNGATIDGAPLADTWAPLPQRCEIDAAGIVLRAERL